MSTVFVSFDQLDAGLAEIQRSPKDAGPVEMIVRRPRPLEREVLEAAQLDQVAGLVGDNWKARGSRHTVDGAAHPDAQITIMNARAIALVAGRRDRWPLAGDQLLVDLDLSVENLPPGTLLAIGAAVVEVTAMPHTGCRQFSERFGPDATQFVNSPEGKSLRLRGINARIVRSGMVRVGDLARKLAGDS